MKVTTMIIILFALVCIFSIIYLLSDFHKYPKFNGYLKFLSAIVIIFTIFTLTIQVKSSKEKTVSDSIYFVSNLTKNFLDDSIKLFMNHKEVNYYYYQLVGLDYRTPKKRYIALENQISNIIFSRASIILFFMDANKDSEIIDKGTLDTLEQKFRRILTSFFKSPIFRENWYMYNKSFGSKILRVYIRKYFSEYVDA